MLEIALEVAREKNRLPLNVVFLDQEAERTTTIDYVRDVMNRPEVKPYWLQIPIKLFNATTFDTEWLECWKPWEERLRDKEPNSIHENVYWSDRFKEMFTYFMKYMHKWEKACMIWWVRCEESPSRYMWLTSVATYKHITYWVKLWENHYTFYPLYDMTYVDIWKYINDNNVKYNKLYDYQFRYWVPVQEMRCSNLHHETAVRSLFYLPEVDIDLYNKLCKRLNWISTAAQIKNDMYQVKDLPFMFDDRRQYRDYLLEKLITDASINKRMKWVISKQDDFINKIDDQKFKDWIIKQQIWSILLNDIDCVKLYNIWSWKLWKLKQDMKLLSSKKQKND